MRQNNLISGAGHSKFQGPEKRKIWAVLKFSSQEADEFPNCRTQATQGQI